MGRKKKRRMVQQEPGVTFYKPQGVPLRQLKDAALTCEGLEALRLADGQGMSQAEGAEIMGVSRATFGRILAEARKTVATALVDGLAIRIEGGHYELADDVAEDQGDTEMPNMKGRGRCMGGQGRGMGQGCGQGRGQGRGQGMGQGKSQNAGQQFQSTPNTQPLKDTDMTMIAVTSEGPTLDDRVDPRFGRCGGFTIVNPETMEVVQYVDNGASQAMAQSAGIQAAENVANAGAKIVLSGYVGPKAFTALKAVGISVGQDVEDMTVREAVELYKQGKVAMAEEANAQAGGNK